MYKKSLIFSVIILFAIFSGCSKKEEPATVEESLAVEPSALSFGKDADNKTFSITSNTKWTVSCSQMWLTCDPASGEGNGVVTIGASANSSLDIREGVVTVKTAGGIEKKVDVSQGGSQPYIILTPEAKDFPFEGGDVTVAVNASGAWSILVPDADKDWISFTQTNVQAVLTVKPNTSAARSSDVIFKLNDSDVQKTFSVTQAVFSGTFLNITPEEMNMTSEGGELTIEVDASGAWTVELPDGVDWITVKSKANNQVVFTVGKYTSKNEDAEDRSATITFKLTGFDDVATFELTQEVGMFPPYFDYVVDCLANAGFPVDNATFPGGESEVEVNSTLHTWEAHTAWGWAFNGDYTVLDAEDDMPFNQIVKYNNADDAFEAGQAFVWTYQLRHKNIDEIKAGDLVIISFYARGGAGIDVTNFGVADLYYSNTGPDDPNPNVNFQNFAGGGVNGDGDVIPFSDDPDEWTRVIIAFKFDYDMPEGKGIESIAIGGRGADAEFGGFCFVNLGQHADDFSDDDLKEMFDAFLSYE